MNISVAAPSSTSGGLSLLLTAYIVGNWSKYREPISVASDAVSPPSTPTLNQTCLLRGILGLGGPQSDVVALGISRQ